MANADLPSLALIQKAQSPAEYEAFRRLTLSYYTWLDEDLDFQGINHELSLLPGKYSAPHGCILVASLPSDDQELSSVGVVAIRPLDDCSAVQHGGRVCEMKRLFVVPDHQGKGIGKMLVMEAIRAAAEAGYTDIVLDTLERLEAANKLYSQLGFKQIDAYYHNPLPSVVYWQLSLHGAH